MPRVLSGSARRLSALAVPLLLAACKTPSAALPRARDTAGSSECAAATVYVAAAPTLFVVSGEQPFLLLDAAVAREGEGEPSFVVGYMASVDRPEMSTEEAPRRAVATASTLLGAFAPVLPGDVHAAVVTALFGKPGSWGLGLPVKLVREAGRWQATAIRALHPVLVPPLPSRVDRPIAGEDVAVLAARRFLESVERGDYDGAWDLVSAMVKASTSRRSFEDDLRADRGSRYPEGRRECFRQYAARGGNFTMGDVLEVCFTSARGAESVQVRLDDDQEWRVARVAHFDDGERQGRAAPQSSAHAQRPSDEPAATQER